MTGSRELRVWAPDARTIDVIVGDGRYELVRGRRGWWSSSERFAVGTDYAFSIDGEDPRPDPRSLHQPFGVHGPSRIVDHTSFEWTDTEWRGRPLATSIVYEIHVGTFTTEGTFDAVIARLDYLVALGIGTVELLPVAEFPGRRGWGYDGAELFAPYSVYGGPDGLKRLVDACHARGLGVVLDVVYNHLGPSGNYLAEFGPYFTDHHTTPWGTAMNFDDRGSDEVRAFLLDNAEMWLAEYHFDGLRIDAVHAIHDESATHVMAELAARVVHLGQRMERPLFLIAESDLNDPRVVGPAELGGWGFDAQWSDDFHHSLHAVLTDERAGYYGDFGRLEDVAKALRQGFVYDGGYSACRDRRHGRPLPAGTPGSGLLGYIQNHDQVGNRAVGERVGHLISVARARVAAALVLTSPFVPMLFAGEEWGTTSPFRFFTDHDDAELGRAVTEGRRREFDSFGWSPDDVPDPQDPETMSACILDWSELDRAEHAEMLDWYRLLIRLRTSEPDLGPAALGEAAVDFDEEAGWLLMRRGRVVVAVNLGELAVELALDPPCTEVLAVSGGAALAAGPGGGACLPPDSVLIGL